MTWINRLLKAYMQIFRLEKDLKAARMTNALCSYHFEDNEGINQFIQKMSKYMFNYQTTKRWKT